MQADSQPSPSPPELTTEVGSVVYIFADTQTPTRGMATVLEASLGRTCRVGVGGFVVQQGKLKTCCFRGNVEKLKCGVSQFCSIFPRQRPFLGEQLAKSPECRSISQSVFLKRFFGHIEQQKQPLLLWKRTVHQENSPKNTCQYAWTMYSLCMTSIPFILLAQRRPEFGKHQAKNIKEIAAVTITVANLD